VTDSSYTHVEIIADKSGSMGEFSDPPRTKAEDATEGVRSFVTDQRAQPGKITFSLTQFSAIATEFASFSDGRDILPSEKLELFGWTCEPSGGTALLDTIAKVITTTGQRLEKMPEDDRPGKVVVLIWTDGAENSSKKYPSARVGGTGEKQIADMIAHQRDVYGWQFVYMGVGEDAYLSAPQMGFTQDEAVFVVADMAPVAYAAASSSLSAYRGGQAQSVSYDTGMRSKLAGKKEENGG
jgi:hypothetical protein